MPSECYRFTIEGISSGNQTSNVHHFLCDNNDDGTPFEIATELCDKWHATFRAFWLQFQSQRYAIRWISAKRILPGGGNQSWREYPGGTEDGGVAVDQAALQCAPIIKLFAGLTAGIQGRIFLPPPPDTQVVSNAVQPTYQSDAIDYVDQMISFSGATHDFNLAVYSKTLGQAHAVTTAAMSPIIGSMAKRRKPL